MPLSASRILTLAGIGVVAGFFSGLFGVGGGIVLVPLLAAAAGFSHRRSSGTSLAAVLPSAVAGVIAYSSHGSVDWLAGGLLAVGAIGGAMIGTWLLHRTHPTILRWLFIAFLVLVAVRMLFLVPDRSVSLDFTPGAIAALIVLGLVTGILSGLLGIGGGVIVVPALMLVFGLGDLVAKGTSLLVMVPTAITGTIANLRRGNADVSAALIIGALAIPASFGGAAVALAVPPALGSILFALLLLASATQLLITGVRRRRSGEE